MNHAPHRSAQTLDPADWQSMRALGHRMVDDMMEYLETLRDRPVWQRRGHGVAGNVGGVA